MEEGGRETLRTLPALVALVLAPAAALAQVTLADLTGRWEVVAVDLRPTRVQALTVNDPAYMGAVLEASRDRLAFLPGKTGTLNDVCRGPRWDGAVVGCASGMFGPPGATATLLGNRLRLEWYDNAILTLIRAP